LRQVGVTTTLGVAVAVTCCSDGGRLVMRIPTWERTRERNQQNRERDWGEWDRDQQNRERDWRKRDRGQNNRERD
jgi:hypothetical protein